MKPRGSGPVASRFRFPGAGGCFVLLAALAASASGAAAGCRRPGVSLPDSRLPGGQPEEERVERVSVNSVEAPAPIGPYSQAVRGGGFLFLSGQIGIDPASNLLVAGGAAAEAEQALRNARAVLAGAGAAPADVLKVTIFLRDMADFQAVNEVYGRFFAAPYPARSTVAVAGLPKGAAVEMELLARDPAAR